jgi:Protein of unknown function (DUF3435)
VLSSKAEGLTTGEEVSSYLSLVLSGGEEVPPLQNRLKRENLERYKREQPVIDSERQLSGKVVDKEVLGVLQRTGAIARKQPLAIPPRRLLMSWNEGRYVGSVQRTNAVFKVGKEFWIAVDL